MSVLTIPTDGLSDAVHPRGYELRPYQELPSRVQSKIQIEPHTGCWLWMGCTDSSGYGHVGWGKRRDGKMAMRAAHKLVYELLTGRAIREGLQSDHLCRTRCCCNPGHIEPVTKLENFRRGLHNQNTAKTHCLRGHPLSGENLYVTPDGKHSHCRECKRETKRLQRRSNALRA
jgi:hypothetical protein